MILLFHACLFLKYPSLYNIGAVCAKIRLEYPREIVETTLQLKDYREAIKKKISDWSDTENKLQEPVRMIGLQVKTLHLIIVCGLWKSQTCINTI